MAKKTIKIHIDSMCQIGRIDALLKTLDGQQDRLEERLEVLASQVPEGVLDEKGMMTGFNNDLVIRYLDRVVVHEDGYEVVFKAGTAVEVRV